MKDKASIIISLPIIISMISAFLINFNCISKFIPTWVLWGTTLATTGMTIFFALSLFSTMLWLRYRS